MLFDPILSISEFVLVAVWLSGEAGPLSDIYLFFILHLSPAGRQALVARHSFWGSRRLAALFCVNGYDCGAPACKRITDFGTSFAIDTFRIASLACTNAVELSQNIHYMQMASTCCICCY